MITLPHEKIQVTGGKLKKETDVIFFSFTEEENRHLIVPRLIVSNKITDGWVCLEISPIKDTDLSCELNPVDIFDVFSKPGDSDYQRYEIVWDLALEKLTHILEFNLQKYPIMGMSLILKTDKNKVYTGEFEDCTILAEFLPDLFDFQTNPGT